MATPLPPEEQSPLDQFLMTMPVDQRQQYMAGLDAAKNFDLGAFQAQYQKAQAAQDAALKAAQGTGLSDQYTQLYGGADIVPGMTQGILTNLGIENPYLPVYTLRGSQNTGGNNANERMSFAALPDTQYRIVDKNTGQTMTATTPEEIKALAETANAMSKSGGINANFQVQSGQGDKFSTIYEDAPDIDKFNKLAATALPIAVSMIPGLQGVGAVLAGAGSGAASAGMTGGNPLKGALTGGLTAAGTQFLGPVIQSTTNKLGETVATNLGRSVGAGIGSTAGSLATGQPIDKALLKGAIAGGTTYLGGELMGGEDKLANTVAENNRLALANLEDGLYNVGADAGTLLSKAYQGQGAFSIPGGPTPTPWAGGKVPSYSDYTVTARTGSTPGTFTVVPNATTTAPETFVNAKIGATDNSKPTVTAPVTTGPTTVVTGTRNTSTPNEKPTVSMPPATTTGPETVVTAKTDANNLDSNEYKGNLTFVPSLVDDIAQQEAAGKTTDTKKKMDVADYLKLAGLAASLVGSATGKGSGSTGKYSSTKNLNSIFSAKLGTPGTGGTFTVGGLSPSTGASSPFAARPMTDWYRYGMGRAMDIPEGMDLSKATSPYAGYGPGTLGQETFNRITGNTSPMAVRREPLPNMISSLGRDATLPQIEKALSTAKTAEEATKINPGTVYFNIDAGTANALGDPSLVGSVMSIQELQHRMAARPMAHGGRLGYEDLTPEEKNFVDYHRRSLAVNPYKHDGDTTTVYGMIDRVDGGEMLHPGYVHGKMMDRDAAKDWAVRSGIDFPVYPDAKTAEERERAIHEDIIVPDLQRYRKGDRDFLKGYSHGGSHEGFAVQGPGTGRSDEIPAVLSDGEYVIDAETVALLGDGSSKAGAKKLDEMRVKIRKAKGKNLAKGKFSVNAKRPEAYMSGGRI